MQTIDQPEPPWREALPRIACPILLIAGNPAVGGVVTPDNAQEMASLWREGVVVQIDGAEHMIHYDRYEAFVEAAREFLAENGEAPGNTRCDKIQQPGPFRSPGCCG